MIWLIVGLIEGFVFTLVGYLIGSGMQRQQMAFVAGECRKAKDERDMLHDYALQMDDALLESQVARDSLAARAQTMISGMELQHREQLAKRDEDIAALKRQLSEVVYEVKPNVATDPPKEVHYVVKTPRRSSRDDRRG